MKKIRDELIWWAAQLAIERSRPKIYAVGGAIAKTSTKVALAAVLSEKYPSQVRAGYGNLNSYLGLPLAILDFHLDFYQRPISWQWLYLLPLAIWRGLTIKLPTHLVLEYGTDKPGDILALTNKLKPDWAFLTIVGSAHLEFYPSEEAIAEEESQLVAAVESSGIVFLNQRDPYLELHRKKAKARSILVDTALEDIAVSFAQALGRELRLSEKVIEEALKKRQPAKHRFQISRIGKITLIDDSYNANPLSMRAALEVLNHQASGRKVAVLGEMRELGQEAERLHLEVGELADKKADLIIGVGELARAYKPERWFLTSQEAAEYLLANFKDGDTILVKGSKAVKMIKIIEALNGRTTQR